MISMRHTDIKMTMKDIHPMRGREEADDRKTGDLEQARVRPWPRRSGKRMGGSLGPRAPRHEAGERGG